MSKPGYTGLTRVIKATQFSVQGLRAAWRHESAFRQECTVTILLIPVAFWLASSWAQAAILLAMCILVLIVELLNSAVEAVVDRIGPEHHDLAGQAKDMGSAAVFLSLVMMLGTWGTVAAQRFLQ